MRFLFNDKTDATLIRFYQTYEKTLDTADYVSPKTNAFVYRFIDRVFKKALRNASKETRVKMKRFRTEAKMNGLTLDDYLDILDAEEQKKAKEAAADIEAEESPDAGNADDLTTDACETDEEPAQDSAEEPEENPGEEDEPEQTG